MKTSEMDKSEKTLKTFKELEAQVKQGGVTIANEAAKSNTVIRVVTVLLACLALLNLHYIHVMSQEFRVMIKDMTAMYELFERSADRMADVTGYVAGMEESIRLMPIINEQMAAMNTDVAGMKNSVNDMTASVGTMDQSMGVIDQDISQMAQRFRSLNANVGSMQHNVNRMSGVVP